MKRTISLLFIPIFIFSLTIFPTNSFAAEKILNDAIKSLEKGIKFFHSISNNGGYLQNYSPDLKPKWGEGSSTDVEITHHPTGTPVIGTAFLRAYKITGEKYYLFCAEDAGDALIWGQKKTGGWDRKFDFSTPYSHEYCTFDDNSTQGTLRFLMALDMIIKKKSLINAVEKGLRFMLESQYETGGWPQWYPLRGGYHDFYTFNDNAMNDCINVMIDAHKNYDKQEYLRSIKKAGNFLILSQIVPPQPGWAQQYNLYLQPAWARSFEPPAVCPSATVRNIKTLIDIYLYTGSGKYLEPIPDAIRWLKISILPNGKWARFCELGTNRPLYYDRGRIPVLSTEELGEERRTGYGYEQNIGLENIVEYYNIVKKLGRDGYLKEKDKPLSRNKKIEKLKSMETAVIDIISSQDEMGRWIVRNDRFKSRVSSSTWKRDGPWIVADRIRSGDFVKNVNLLCDYIELAKSINH